MVKLEDIRYMPNKRRGGGGVARKQSLLKVQKPSTNSVNHDRIVKLYRVRFRAFIALAPYIYAIKKPCTSFCTDFDSKIIVKRAPLSVNGHFNMIHKRYRCICTLSSRCRLPVLLFCILA